MVTRAKHPVWTQVNDSSSHSMSDMRYYIYSAADRLYRNVIK